LRAQCPTVFPQMFLKIILAFEIQSVTQVEWCCACSFSSRVSWRLHASSFLYFKWVWVFVSKSWSSTHESRAKPRPIWIGIWLTWNIRCLLIYFMQVFPFMVIVRVFTCGSFLYRMRPVGWTWIEYSQNTSKVAESTRKCPSSLSTCASDGHFLRVTIPDAVLIQFDLLRMSKIFLETCTCRGI